MTRHTHKLVLRGDREQTLVSSASTGDVHDHQYSVLEDIRLADGIFVSAGTSLMTNVESMGTNHRHRVQMGERSQLITELAYVHQVVESLDAVRDVSMGVAVEKNSSRLPHPLEQDVPSRLRFWKAETPAHRAALRDELIRSGFVHTVKTVDGSSRSVVTVDGAPVFRRIAHSSEYVGDLLSPFELSKMISNRERDAVIPLFESVVFVDDDMLASLSACAQTTKSEHAIQLVLNATKSMVVQIESDVAKELPEAFQSVVWRPENMSKWNISTSIPGGDMEYLAPTSDRNVSMIVQRTPVVQDDVPVLMSWMSTVLNSDDMVGSRARELVQFVVEKENDRAEPRQSVYKSLGVDDPTLQMRVEKAFESGQIRRVQKNDERQEITYLVMAPVGDLHADLSVPDQIRKTAEGYIRFCRRVGMHHEGGALSEDDVALIGHWVFDEPIEMFDTAIPEGTWLMKLRFFDDDLWTQGCDGTFGGVSPQGRARRRPIDTPTED